MENKHPSSMYFCVCVFSRRSSRAPLVDRSHTIACIYHSIVLSIVLSIYLSIYVSIYLFIYVCMYVCIYLSIYVSIYLSIYLSISIYLPIYISICSSSKSCFKTICRFVARTDVYTDTSFCPSLCVLMQDATETHDIYIYNRIMTRQMMEDGIDLNERGYFLHRIFRELASAFIDMMPEDDA
jgi:hypothetical protein